MKLVIKTNTQDSYFVTIPNYLNSDNYDTIFVEALRALPEGVICKTHHIHSDDLTDEERKQIDWWGEIRHPLIPLQIDI